MIGLVEGTADTSIVILLAGAVAAEFGVIVWLFKNNATRDAERIKALEGAQFAALQQLAATVAPLPAAMQDAVTMLRELRIAYLTRREGGQP